MAHKNWSTPNIYYYLYISHYYNINSHMVWTQNALLEWLVFDRPRFQMCLFEYSNFIEITKGSTEIKSANGSGNCLETNRR